MVLIRMRSKTGCTKLKKNEGGANFGFVLFPHICIVLSMPQGIRDTAAYALRRFKEAKFCLDFPLHRVTYRTDDDYCSVVD